MLRYLTAGESHGRALVATIEGIPAQVAVTSADLADALARRRLGVGRGARMKFEADEVTVLAGVRHGLTLGSPIAVLIDNSEWSKWETVMSADPVDPAELTELARNAALTRPRPGHADLAGMQKYDWDEARPILERASARETAARVALGRVAANFLAQAFGIEVLSHVVRIGSVSSDPSSGSGIAGKSGSGIAGKSGSGVAGKSGSGIAGKGGSGIAGKSGSGIAGSAAVDGASSGPGIAGKSDSGTLPRPADLAAIDAHPVRCFDAAAGDAMLAEIAAAKAAGDTLGGVVEVLAYGLPPGLGSHIQWDRRLDARLAQALMGIQAIKGVEVGDGFALAASRGSLAHDEILPGEAGVLRSSNRSGGTEGGMSNGEVLRVRAAMKPIATVPRALQTVDVTTGEAAPAHHQRSDVCAVPAAGVVAEAMVALVLAEVALEKFGGDSLAETRRNYAGYLARLSERRLG